jgi:hypothetical protein
MALGGCCRGGSAVVSEYKQLRGGGQLQKESGRRSAEAQKRRASERTRRRDYATMRVQVRPSNDRDGPS